MRNYLTIAGRDSRDFGVYISGQGTFSAPEKAYKFYEVPGRNGNIIGYDHRLMNIEVSYECFIYTNFNQNIADFRSFLLSLNGYQKLTDSYHPDEYRMAVYVGPFEPEVTAKNNAGSFTLTFNCKPQRYLNSGETSYTWVPGGDQGVTGYDLDVYTQRFDPTFLTLHFPRKGLFSTEYKYHITSFCSYYSTRPTSWRIKIDGAVVYYVQIARTFGYDLERVTEVTLDIINKTGECPSLILQLPETNDWEEVEQNMFRAAIDYSAQSKYGQAVDHLIDGNWFKPVTSVQAMRDDNDNCTVYYDGTYMYLRIRPDSGTYDLTGFKNWYNLWRSPDSPGSLMQEFSGIQIEAAFDPPLQFTLYNTFNPTFPSPTFKLSTEFYTPSHPTEVQNAKIYETIKYTGSDSMSNPTMFPSEPLIRVYGTGSFEMDGVTVTVSTCTSYTDIDCELMDCYEGSTNRNNAVSFSTYDFPKLQPGDNAITVNTGISAVEITPRWWQV